jgi:peptidoglycan/xylan/chitin deacetylase (PgdA/CDA1 family)
MKQMNFFCSVFFASLTAFCHSRTADNSYAVGTWRGFASAAVSFTFDDGFRNQFSVAIPMFDQKQFKLTLFTVVTGGMFPGWKKLDSAAAKGHEVASHTMMHSDLSGLDNSKQEYELKNSKDSINAHIPGKQCITVAYPYCNQGNDSICQMY